MGTLIPFSRHFGYKIKEFFIVEEHLGHDVIGAGFRFLLEVSHVCLQVGGLEVFFRVAGHADAEFGFDAAHQVVFQVDAVVHGRYLLEQFNA